MALGVQLMKMDHQLDGIHVIPVPDGMTIEEAWANIAKGALFIDPQPGWATVEVKDGELVQIHYPDQDNVVRLPSRD
jgi:hypothetical protein